ncbi:galactokinase [Wenyingzhuangia fucanilytica]|uniref:Galactokinase n=1 Tax=Wenyingzhuangia fucanilytica TaxID=1790137 RepID=A0A1B1Y8I0_9FLAO|nr:galactokinase [Wenyingzhuangia fucanilytica]ANW97083.1 galactokinase [Wenyingzhuangia fucanilytica]
MDTKLVQKVTENFAKNFTAEPVLIYSPGRINLIGEHTDYNAGFVFPAAIDKGIVAAIQKTDKNVSTAIAIDMNETFQFDVNNLDTKNLSSWHAYVVGVVAETQKLGKTVGNFDIVFGGNIPDGAGMSSSAALENSVVFGVNELFNLGLTKYQMILISQAAEHNYVGVKCGIMDQYASMFGIENSALLLDCRTAQAEPFTIDFKDYQLLLFNTNVKHKLSDSAYNDRRAVCEKTAEMLGIDALRDATIADLDKVKGQLSEEDYQKVLYVVQENARAEAAAIAIKSDDLVGLGKLIYGSHNGLQHQYKVSCEELDFLVDLAKENSDVLGARMMGGGFGGCTINLIKKTAVEGFKKTAVEAYTKKFGHECSPYEVALSDGTKLI